MMLFVGSGVVGAAESVCAVLLCVRAASASDRVFGVRPDGVPGKMSLDLWGSSRREGASVWTIVAYVPRMEGMRGRVLLGRSGPGTGDDEM